MSTLPRLFIIESLKLEDEKEDLFEGGHLSKMLRLSGTEPQYMYLRTKRELAEAVDLFEDSEFRYLHLSCHGNKNGIALTLDSIPFKELGEMLGPVLAGKRIFFSSCSVMNENAAGSLLRGTDCLSVIGPSRKIEFDRATAFWSSFYHLRLRDEAKSMKRDQIRSTVTDLKRIFAVHMRYYTASKTQARGFSEVSLTDR